MFDALRKLFEAQPAAREAEGQAARRRLAVATCALLLEAAQADDEFSPAEKDLVTALVRERFGLAGDDLEGLLELAESRRQSSAGLYEFTRLIGQHTGHAGKLEILELLWRVVYRDGRLEAREDALMHKLARLLELPHGDLIALKLRVKGSGGSPEGDGAAGDPSAGGPGAGPGAGGPA
jgi:uncharacterized tellurite resistance protein B-like protein